VFILISIVQDQWPPREQDQMTLMEVQLEQCLSGVSASPPIYEDTKLILDKDIKLKWKEVNDAFVSTFWEDLKDHQVYVNIHKYGLYWIACRYPMFPCMDMIHWIVSHTSLEWVTLSSVHGMKIATFRA